MDYRLIINEKPKGKPLCFSYGKTKWIELTVSAAGASADCELGKDYRGQLPDCYLGNLIKEAMKRASLVYLLQFQKPLSVCSLRLEVIDTDGRSETVDIQDRFTLYSMITGKLLRPIPSEWKQHDILQIILTYQKSKERMSREIASLYAYLYSKTRQFETERFFFLWMTMNGFFAACDPANNGKDRNQMETFVLSVNSSLDVLTRDNRDRLCRMTTMFLNSVSSPIKIHNIDDQMENSFAEYIRPHIPSKKDGSRYRVSLYTLLLTDYPYYLRCRMFHANRPIELFSFKDDYELKALGIVNNLIEDYLDRNLVTLFSAEKK